MGKDKIGKTISPFPSTLDLARHFFSTREVWRVQIVGHGGFACFSALYLQYRRDSGSVLVSC